MKSLPPNIEPLESRIAPAVFTVTTLADTTDANHDTGSLRDALALADAHAGPDTILFKLPAPAQHGVNTITLTLGQLTSTGNVKITGPGAGKLLISGHDTNGVFSFTDGTSGKDSPVSISGLSIVDGNTTGNGGGIYSAESLTLKNVVVSGNTANANGGGVYVAATEGVTAKVSISGSLITGNVSNSGDGGGVEDLGSTAFSMSKTVVTGNVAPIGAGGGVYAVVAGTGASLAVTGCEVAGNTAKFEGGMGLTDQDSAATSKILITGTKIVGNASTSSSGDLGGGGLCLIEGNAVITGSVISDNTAVLQGGGMQANQMETLTISKSIISGNRTTGSASQRHGGAGLFLQGTPGSATPYAVHITGSQITDNQSAQNGGGILAGDQLAVTITGTKISGNGAATGGGGISIYGYTIDSTSLTMSGGSLANNTGNGAIINTDAKVSVTGTKITGNVGGGGGGMYVRGSSGVTLTKAMVTGNEASADGGGLMVLDVTALNISGGSIGGNRAAQGAGIYIYNGPGSILGVTISGNTASSQGGGISNEGLTPAALKVQEAKVTGNTAPVLPNIYGTVTAVGPAAAAEPAGHGTILVTTTADTTDAQHDTGSLRDALALADATPNTVDTIEFALPAVQLVQGEWIIKLNGTELTSTGNVNIVGPGVGKLIINANSDSRAFDFKDIGSTADRPVSISGLSIIGGHDTSGKGGGIYSTESLTLKNVVISGNTTTGSGGGVFLYGSGTAPTKATITGSLITGNKAGEFGGGVYIQDVQSLTISKCAVTGNVATSLVGGGVDGGLSSTGKSLAVTGTLVAGNTAKYGGGIYLLSQNAAATSKINVTGTTIAGNVSTGTGQLMSSVGLVSGGGGLVLGTGNSFVTGSTIENNRAVYYGGGISAASKFDSLTISKSVVSGNQTTSTDAFDQGGGGMFLITAGTTTPQPVKITGTVFDNNVSDGDGGGLLAFEALGVSVTGSTFAGNHADGSGGGLASEGTVAGTASLVVKGCGFTGNSAAVLGGGILAGSRGSTSITGTKLIGNTGLAGGGVGVENTNAFTLTGATVMGNTSFQGGGLSILLSTNFQVSGGTFIGNSATRTGSGQGEGGGIFVEGSTGSILGTIISGNAGNAAGGGVFNDGTTAGEVTLQIAKVVGNSAPVGANVDDTAGTLASFTFV